MATFGRRARRFTAPRSLVLEEGRGRAAANSAAVRRLEPIGDFAGDAQRFIERQSVLALEPVAQRFAFDIWRDVEQQSIGFARVQQRQDVRVTELCGDLDLAEKAVGAERVGQLGLEDLDRDEAVVLQVAGAIHDRHAALPQLPFYRIPAAQGSGESLALVDWHNLICTALTFSASFTLKCTSRTPVSCTR